MRPENLESKLKFSQEYQMLQMRQVIKQRDHAEKILWEIRDIITSSYLSEAGRYRQIEEIMDRSWT